MKKELCRLHKGDIVSTGLICRLKGTFQTVTETKHYLQLGEAADYAFTLDRRLEPLYATFSEFKGQWRYHGYCFKYGTIDQSWR